MPPCIVASRYGCRRASAIPTCSTGPLDSGNKLAKIIRRKHQEIDDTLQQLGMEGLEQRLQTVGETSVPRPYRFSQRVAEIVETFGRPALAFEVHRPSKDSSSKSEGVASIAERLVEAGADAIVVPTDSEETPTGLGDLFAVSQVVRVPVLMRDWILHPLQIAEAKEAGCAGVIGVIAQVTGDKGTPLLSSYASSLGLDCPIEIVNMNELRSLEKYEVPFYGMNLSVGLSVSIAGFGADVAEGLLGEFPFGVLSIAGAGSIDEARKMRQAGADALLIKRSFVEQWEGREQEMVDALLDATNGDD